MPYDHGKPPARRRFLVGCAAVAASAATGASGAERQVTWLKEIQQPPASLPSTKKELSSLLIDQRGDVITTRAAWEKQRAVIMARWKALLGELDARRDGHPRYEILAEDRIDDIVRQRIGYEVEPGIGTEAYLLMPANAEKRKSPGVVVFHSTVDSSIQQPAGVKGEPAKAFGLQLAKRGFVTICPRNFLWPTNDKISAKQEAESFLKRQPKRIGMAKMLHDGQVALDLLASHSSVDPHRIGVVGHSLGAKEALYMAAFDDRVKATVSSEGGIGMTFSNWHDNWYLGPQVKEPNFALDHHELLALAAPRPFLLIGGDSADGDQSWPYIEAALPVYRLYDTPPRLGLYNHKQGHSVPADAVQRLSEWCETYL